MKLIRRSNNLIPATPFFFDDYIGSDLADWFKTTYNDKGLTTPAVNFRETDESYEVELAAPGLNRKDFKVEIDHNILTISSERNEDREEKNEQNGYFMKEFAYTSFQRCFRLPENKIDSEKIKANYTDGILKVEIPKREEAKPKPVRKIEIN
jgi:HSP20 family protein